MKKSFKKCLFVGILTFVTLFSFTTIANATVDVLKSYHYDVNIFGRKTNQHNHKWITVPNKFSYDHEESKSLYKRWNYERFENVYFYRIGNGTIV